MVNTYLKEAASNLSRAAVARRQELDELRKQMDTAKAETNKEIEKLKTQISQIETKALLISHANEEISKTLEIERIKQRAELKNVIKLKIKEVAKIEEESKRSSEAIEQEIHDLQRQAHELDIKAG